MPDKALEVIGSTKRFKVLYGGRRSSKTYSFVDAVITRAAYHPTLVLCTRELQKSIRDSIHKTLRVRISDLGLDQYFDIEKSSIYSKCGSEFIFMGVRHNATEIKGLEGIDICLIEEAEKMSQDSWDVLEPTISKDGSEIWVDTHHSLIVADQSESDVRALAESEMVEFYSLDAFTLRHDLPNAFAQLQLF